MSMTICSYIRILSIEYIQVKVIFENLMYFINTELNGRLHLELE